MAYVCRSIRYAVALVETTLCTRLADLPRKMHRYTFTKVTGYIYIYIIHARAEWLLATSAAVALSTVLVGLPIVSFEKKVIRDDQRLVTLWVIFYVAVIDNRYNDMHRKGTHCNCSLMVIDYITNKCTNCNFH